MILEGYGYWYSLEGGVAPIALTCAFWRIFEAYKSVCYPKRLLLVSPLNKLFTNTTVTE